MSVQRGFEDLKPKKILAIDSRGIATVLANDDKLLEMQLWIGSSGAISARPIEPVPIDQVGSRRVASVRERWADTDQGRSGGAIQ